jgi:predicted transcriptional regulator
LRENRTGSSHVSLRVPDNLIEAYEKLAATLDRPRSWVMLRALRHYLEDEGAEIMEDTESLAELDRGEIVSAEDVRRRVEEAIARVKKARAQQE